MRMSNTITSGDFRGVGMRLNRNSVAHLEPVHPDHETAGGIGPDVGAHGMRRASWVRADDRGDARPHEGRGT